MRDVDVHEVYQHRLLYPLHHDDTPQTKLERCRLWLSELLRAAGSPAPVTPISPERARRGPSPAVASTGAGGATIDAAASPTNRGSAITRTPHSTRGRA